MMIFPNLRMLNKASIRRGGVEKYHLRLYRDLQAFTRFYKHLQASTEIEIER